MAYQFHPDRNRNPQAEAVFKEVNEAYQVLGTAEKRWAYDQQRLSPQVPAHRDPAVRRRPPGYRPQPKGPSETFLVMQTCLPYLVWVFYFGLAISILFALDRALPSEIENQPVVFQRATYARQQNVYLVNDAGRKYGIAPDDLPYLANCNEISVRSSALLSILINITNRSTGYTTTNLASLYRNYLFAPLVLFIVSVLGLAYRKGVEFRFNMAIVAIFVLLLTLIFYLQSTV